MKERNETFLKLEDVVVEYSSGKETVHAVNGVSLELAKGETLGLVGETGAGKTTIAKAILRILPVPPAKFKSGKISLDGQEMTALSEPEMQKIRGGKVAMIFQDPMTALNPLMTVGDQIIEVLRLHNKDMDTRQLHAKAVEMLELVGIAGERFVEFPHQFSGGMKQRVVIAMALACNPELLLADEPTTALDVTIQAQVLDLIRDLREKFNTSMILITHDLGVVAETCDKVAVIYAGYIVEQGDKRALFKEPTHPYTLGLFGSLPNMVDDDEELKPIPGLPPDPTNLPSGCPFWPRCDHADEACKKALPSLEQIGENHAVRCFHAAEVSAARNSESVRGGIKA